MTGSSLRTLASTLDKASESGSFISEAAESLIVSELPAETARQVADGFQGAGWEFSIFDAAGTDSGVADISADFGPYRVTAKKPEQTPGTVLLLTSSGLGDWLSKDSEASVVVVVGLDLTIATRRTRYIPEDGVLTAFQADTSSKSPRTLVREFGSNRIVPKDIDRWLLLEPIAWNVTDPRLRLWINHAVLAIVPALPNEIDPGDSALVFRGPPRLSLTALTTREDYVSTLGKNGFADLQAAAAWIYELDRESETRHTFFSTEFARTGARAVDTATSLKENLGPALEGAKIAHAMSLAKISADNLKALADLRKAVTDETGKITDATRQVVSAVASALAVGIALIAARVAANAPPLLVVAVMVVVCAYIGIIIFSGYGFVTLQRDLRDVWRHQIYRFLSEDDYDKLVVAPGRKAERILCVTSIIGAAAVIVMFMVSVLVAFFVQPPAPAAVQESSASYILPIIGMG